MFATSCQLGHTDMKGHVHQMPWKLVEEFWNLSSILLEASVGYFADCLLVKTCMTVLVQISQEWRDQET